MPPKNIRKRKWVMEQKKIITSKLLKISLRLDDYVYQKRPISIQEAKTYAEEIAQLKIKCTDARSLQVSEKLTSIVKNIIDEQYQNDITSADDTNTPLQLNENSEAINENNQKNYISVQTINIVNVPQPEKEREINETSPNLSITKDVDNNVAAVNVMERKDTAENISVKTTIEDLNVDTLFASAPIDVSKNIQNTQNMVTKESNDHMNEVDVNPSISVNEVTNNTCNECNKISNPINEEINNNIGKESDKININSTLTNINETVCDNKKYVSENKRQEMSSKNPKSKKRTVRKKNDKTVFKNNAIPNTNLKSSAKKSKKKREVMDLSWIENIKYVREVNAEELIVTNLQESFWSNLSMPAISNCDF